MPNHCQICGREIKAKSGRIAHHGYRRPGLGWQTSSCMGARELPYEVSCDAISGAMTAITRRIASLRSAWAAFLQDPPAEIRVPIYSGKPQYGMRTHQRPEGFNPADRPVSYMGNERYRYYYYQQVDHFPSEIAGLEQFYRDLHERKENWKPVDTEKE